MVNLEQGKQHLIIKRDGSKEQYNPDKLFKVTNWATNENETITHILLVLLLLFRHIRNHYLLPY